MALSGRGIELRSWKSTWIMHDHDPWKKWKKNWENRKFLFLAHLWACFSRLGQNGFKIPNFFKFFFQIHKVHVQTIILGGFLEGYIAIAKNKIFFPVFWADAWATSLNKILPNNKLYYTQKFLQGVWWSYEKNWLARLKIAKFLL